jgi:hypothetical protein
MILISTVVIIIVLIYMLKTIEFLSLLYFSSSRRFPYCYEIIIITVFILPIYDDVVVHNDDDCL